MFALPPNSNEPNHDAIRLADWVELNLLVQEEPFMSVVSTTGAVAAPSADDADDDEDRERFWARAEVLTEQAFAVLLRRASWGEDRYPLRVDGETALLHSHAPGLGVSRFLSLLRARQLYSNALGDDGEESGLLFEDLVTHALAAYVHASPEHRVRFGVAGGFRGGGLPEPLAEAIVELAHRMGELTGIVADSERGDLGADAIAWRPFGDEHGGQLVAIAQATISENEWRQREPAAKWTDRRPPATRLVRFMARPLTVVAFAETLSLTPRDTLDGLTSSGFASIPFDRLRIVSVLRDDDVPDELLERMDRWGTEMQGRLSQ